MILHISDTLKDEYKNPNSLVYNIVLLDSNGLDELKRYITLEATRTQRKVFNSFRYGSTRLGNIIDRSFLWSRVDYPCNTLNRVVQDNPNIYMDFDLQKDTKEYFTCSYEEYI